MDNKIIKRLHCKIKGFLKRKREEKKRRQHLEGLVRAQHEENKGLEEALKRKALKQQELENEKALQELALKYQKKQEREEHKGKLQRGLLGDVGPCIEKQSYTERLLLKALNSLGFYPEEQYQVSMMTVDLAFPEKKVIIEINGPHHTTEGQRLVDNRRAFVLRSYGWKVWSFKSEKVYNNPLGVAKRIIRKLSNTPY